jgi:hypothetical protein
MQQKKHLEQTGLLEIIDLAFQMNPSGKRKNTKLFLFETIQKGLPNFQVDATLPENKLLRYPLNITEKTILDPWYITGLTDGEGCFTVSLKIINGRFFIAPCFSISQHRDSLLLVEKIKLFFSCGSISQNSSDGIFSIKFYKKTDLVDTVIPHFRRYSLKTSKAFSFICFTEILNLYYKKDLTLSEIREIIQLTYSMNPGGKKSLSEQITLDMCSTLQGYKD